MQISEETLKALEAEYNGKIRLFQDASGDPPEWVIVVRKPNGKEATAFRLAANNESRKAYAALDVIKATCVWPDKKELAALIDDNPLMPEGIAGSQAWKQWVGLEVAETQKRS